MMRTMLLKRVWPLHLLVVAGILTTWRSGSMVCDVAATARRCWSRSSIWKSYCRRSTIRSRSEYFNRV